MDVAEFVRILRPHAANRILTNPATLKIRRARPPAELEPEESAERLRLMPLAGKFTGANMRLTLRTLLAYLDDRLPPANAREIGQRIAKSPFATELTERIKDVKRKRRLAANPKGQPTIDPNLVAEYLDDQLTPELVARVEREILSSDVLLAEVSSAHEILGLLREPVTVEPRLRDRLYALDPTGQTDVVRALGHQAGSSNATPTPAAAWKPMASSAPSTGRRVAIIAGCLGLVWLLVTMTDSGLLSGPATAPEPAIADNSAPAVDQGAKPIDAIIAANDVDAISKDATPNESASPDAALPVANSDPSASVTVAANDAAVVGNPDAASDTASNVAVADPVPDANVVMPDKAANDAAPVEPEPVAVPAEPVLAAAMRIQADSRSVLCFDPGQSRWTSLARVPGGDLVTADPNLADARPLLDQQWFGVPEPFQLIASAADSGWTLTTEGHGLARLLPAGSDGIEFIEGRAILRADKAVAWNDAKRPVFHLGTGAFRAALTLQTAKSWAAIEVVPTGDFAATDEPAAGVVVGSPLPSDADLVVRVMVIEGEVACQLPDAAEPTIVAQNSTLSWKALRMTQFTDVAMSVGPGPAAMPTWVLKPSAPETEIDAAIHEQLRTALNAPTEPGDAVLPLLSERNPQPGVLAARSLSQMRDSERLLTLLFEKHDEVIHRAAIEGLTSIVNSSATRRAEVQRSLSTRVHMSEVEFLMNLIIGLTPTQLSSQVVTSELLSGLTSDRLLTRTLVIYRMEQAVGDRYGFHADGEASRQREAIRRWEKAIDRNGGVLVK